jgi:hypothetical protein
MTDDRVAGLVLIAGTVGTIVTMAVHPAGSDLFVPGRFAAAARLTLGAHALAIACLPLLFAGMLVFTRGVAASSRLAVFALVVFGLAAIAAMAAGTMSGLVAPGVAREILDAAPPAADTWRALFDFTGDLNQAFARVFVMASVVAIGCWSVQIVRTGRVARGIGVYGLVAGSLIAAGLAVGHLRLNVHGFGMVVLAEAIWYGSVGAALVRRGSR